ncbi:MAG: hypothetical protein ABIH39_08085 [Candidatus Margulisiibacteriota bacterium]
MLNRSLTKILLITMTIIISTNMAFAIIYTGGVGDGCDMAEGALAVYWDGDGADLKWNTPANWSTNEVPDELDDVIIDDTYVTATQSITAETTPISYKTLSISSAAHKHYLSLSVAASGGSVTIGVGGYISAGSQTITCSGSWNASAGGFNPSTGTVYLTGTGTVSTEAEFAFTDFNHLHCAAAGHTTTIVGAQLWMRDITVGSGTLTDGANSYEITLYGSDNVFTDGGATITIGTFTYRPHRGAVQNVVGRDYSGCSNLQLYGVGEGGAGAEDSYCDMQGDITANNIRIYANNYSAEDVSAVVLRTNNYNIVANYLIIGLGSYMYGGIECGSSNIDINGHVQYSNVGDTFINADSSNWTVNGNWSNGVNGTFNCGTSTITLDGTAQTIYGINTFYNLSKTVTSADTLTFDNTDTQTVSNNLILKGAPGQKLSLRSNSDGNQYSLNLNQDTRYTLEHLDIKDCDASGGKTIDADKSKNSGNNNNVTFDADSFFDVF